jgi:hypothetical protein
MSASAERVALIVRCAECGEFWLPADEERWSAYLDTHSELVFYCRECAVARNARPCPCDASG